METGGGDETREILERFSWKSFRLWRGKGYHGIGLAFNMLLTESYIHSRLKGKCFAEF